MTKLYKFRQSDLSIEQQNAIDLLITGKTDQEVADAVGVSRQTVNGWRNDNIDFVAELQRRRCRLWSNEIERLRALVPKAIGVLASDLDSADLAVRRQAALHVLKACGIYGGISAPELPTQAKVRMNLELLE